MSWLMGLIYTGISWILLRWHDLFDLILPDRRFLGTNWDWVLAIVFLVLTVRAILFPIFVRQIRSQRAMQALQPKLKELQKKHEGDKQTLQQEMMKLYQTEKVNPLMGCLPMFLQVPVFLGLFHVLKGLNPIDTGDGLVTRELYGWRAEQWDSAVQARLFNAPLPAHFNSDAASLAFLDASGGVVKAVAVCLVIIMMVTTFLTSRQMIVKTGWNQDPQQRMIQRLMLYGIPVTLLFSGFFFPLGVIIYWVTQNIISLGQQHWVLHRYPPPVSETKPVAPARAANAKPANAFVRFMTVQPPLPKRPGSAAARSGLLGRVLPGRAVAPVAETRPAAPRPGAKPVVGAKPGAPVRPRTAAADPVTIDGDVVETVAPEPVSRPPARSAAAKSTANGSSVNGSAKAPGVAAVAKTKPTPAKSVPTKATPAKSVPAKAAPATSTSAMTPAPAATTKAGSPTQSSAAKKAAPAKAGARKSPAGKKGGRRH